MEGIVIIEYQQKIGNEKIRKMRTMKKLMRRMWTMVMKTVVMKMTKMVDAEEMVKRMNMVITGVIMRKVMKMKMRRETTTRRRNKERGRTKIDEDNDGHENAER